CQPSPSVSRASQTLFLLVSVVSNRRDPYTWASELMRNVECHSRTVESMNPISRPDQPPMRKLTTPRVQGAIQSWREMKRISGYFEKSFIEDSGSGLLPSSRIHPTWLHQNPFLGVCGSSGVSV